VDVGTLEKGENSNVTVVERPLTVNNF